MISTAAAAAERRVRDYAAMGLHRTGWPADDRAAEWLIDELRAAGIEAHAQPFRAPRWAWQTAEVRVGGRVVQGQPMSDAGCTGPAGVTGSLAQGGGIVLWERGPDDPARMAAGIYDDLARLEASGAQAVVLLMGDEHGNPVLRNAERPWNPIALPVLQVAPADAAGVDWGSGEATVIIDGAREEAAALNVAAEVPGSDADAAPVALITPKSGWFSCAAERGGGIAVWLGAAERIAAGAETRRSLRLLASSGHELHHLGLDHYLNSLGAAAAHVSAWVHLGASIGARRGSPRFAASDGGLLALAQAALDAAGVVREPFPVGEAGFGEARNVAEIGGRFISLLGGHPYFHSPMDTFDAAVDLDLLVRHIDAVEQIVRTLLR